MSNYLQSLGLNYAHQFNGKFGLSKCYANLWTTPNLKGIASSALGIAKGHNSQLKNKGDGKHGHLQVGVMRETRV